MSNERAFLEWLNDQEGYYVEDRVVERKFPNLTYEMVGVTKTYNEDTGEVETPKRDWRQAVKYHGVID